MRQTILAFMMLCAVASAGHAQGAVSGSDPVALQTRQDSEGWEAVGRLDISGKGFCTAALIRDRLILTAAHCLYDNDGSLIESSRFSFNAGMRDGRAEATRQINRAVPHPDYNFHEGSATEAAAVAMDIAVLELDRPIRTTRIRPFLIAQQPMTGDSVGVVSYARGREDTPSLQEVCMVLGRQTGVLVMTCEVDHGSSGSPVFMVENGETRIASVVSAMGFIGEQKVSLGTSLSGPLNALLSHFAALGPAQPGGTQRLISIGDRNETGAKFVRP